MTMYNKLCNKIIKLNVIISYNSNINIYRIFQKDPRFLNVNKTSCV